MTVEWRVVSTVTMGRASRRCAIKGEEGGDSIYDDQKHNQPRGVGKEGGAADKVVEA